jgi:hypothetical protein
MKSEHVVVRGREAILDYESHGEVAEPRMFGLSHNHPFYADCRRANEGVEPS